MRTERTLPTLHRAAILAVAMLWAFVPVAQAAHHIHHDHAIAGDEVVHVGCDHAATVDAPSSPAGAEIAAARGAAEASACDVTPIPSRAATAPDVAPAMRLIALPTLAARPPPVAHVPARDQWRLPPANGPPARGTRA